MALSLTLASLLVSLVVGREYGFFSKNDGSAISNISSFCDVEGTSRGARIVSIHPLVVRPTVFHLFTFGIAIEITQDGEAYFLVRGVLYHSNDYNTLVLRKANVSLFSVDHVRRELWWIENGELFNFFGRQRSVPPGISRLEVTDGVVVTVLGNRSVFVDGDLVVPSCSNENIPFFAVVHSLPTLASSDPPVLLENVPPWLSLVILLCVVPLAEIVRRMLKNRRIHKIESHCCCTSVLDDEISSRRSLPLLHKDSLQRA